MSKTKITPAQDQMLDLLVARHRLGEPFWPMSNALLRTARALEASGLIDILHGHVDGTFRAALTPLAKKKYIEKSKYTSPVERDTARKIASYVENHLEQPVVAMVILKEFA